MTRDSGRHLAKVRILVSLLCAGLVGVACGSAPPPDIEGGGLSPRHSPAVAWVGDRLFVYGGWPALAVDPPPTGEDPFAGSPRSAEGAVLSLTDGALFDPESTSMRSLPAAPFPDPVQYPQAVAVDDEVVVLGTDCPHPNPDPEDSSGFCEPGTYVAAAYSPTEEAWREIALPPALKDTTNGASEVLGATTDGRVIFQLGPREHEDEQVWSYSPSEDRWRRLPSPGAFVNARCLAGDTLAVATGAGRRQPSLRLLTLTAREPRWREAAAPATGNLAEHAHQGTPILQLDCTDDRVFFRINTEEPQFHRVLPGDEGDDWLVPSPSPARGSFNRVLGIGRRMIFFNRNNIESAVYDPATDEWQLLEGDLAVGDPIWTGEAITGWPGGDGAVRPQFFPFRPIDR